LLGKPVLNIAFVYDDELLLFKQVIDWCFYTACRIYCLKR